MFTLRSRWLVYCMVAFAALSTHAQEQKPIVYPHAIAEGSTFLIRLEDKLDAGQVRPGKRFKGKLADDLVAPDETRVPRGSRIRGHVSEVGNGLHPHLLLSFDEIETSHGWAPLIATIIGVPGEHGLTTGSDEGEIQRQGSSQRRDPDSEGIGSKTQAAAGVMRAIFSDHRLLLQKGTMLEVRLDRPLQLTRR